MSTAFDYGGIRGGGGVGLVERLEWEAGLGQLPHVPRLHPLHLDLYSVAGHTQLGESTCCLLFLVGVVVNGPYTLISSAVCSDLGSHPSLKGNPLAMSTVTGIIDGFGSAGAAMEGPVVSGLYKVLGWDSVFYALMVFSLMSCLTIVRVVKHELFGKGGTASYGALPENSGDAADEGESTDDEERLTTTTEIEPGIVVYEARERDRRINT